MILYSFFMSSCAWRVRIALEVKRIQYEYRSVNLVSKEQEASAYMGVNGLGQVPALVDGPLTLTQSLPIIEYLEEVQPLPPLLPTERVQRARVRQLCEIINAGIQPLQSGPYFRMEELGGAGAGQAYAHQVISKGFAALERLLQETSGSCCVGDHLTMADCCLVPQVFNAMQRFKVDMSKFPVIMALYERLVQRPEFVASHPTNVPDFNPQIAAKLGITKPTTS